MATTETTDTTEFTAPETETLEVDAVDAPETTEPPEIVEEVEDTGKGNREAAKYRRQLRDAETQLETIQAALTAARGELLENAVTGYKVGRDTFNIIALNDAGLDPNALFDDRGKLNMAAVAESMQSLAVSHPYMFTAEQRLHIPNEGKSPSGSTSVDAWQGAFQNKN